MVLIWCCFMLILVISDISVGKHRNSTVRKLDNSHSPQVRLKNGILVLGKHKQTHSNKTYSAFKGIPYARPPVGPLRFQPPVSLPNDFFQGIINATKEVPPCLQSDILPNDVYGSEDCLYINVYLPELPHENSSLLAVMVWIYGGAFISGDSRYTSFGPDYFMNEGSVIIVTFNYRIGIFGFLSTEDEVSPGNYGLKDQILALNWVRENIQSFGGNPKSVTIFGESAGSASVSYLTQTPLTNGLFHAAILESGTSLCLWGLAKNPKHTATTVASLLKVNTASSKTIVDGLRKVNYKDLQAAATTTEYGKIVSGNILNGLSFAPTMEPSLPGAVLVNDSFEQLASGLFHNNVSYLVGYNSMEAVPLISVVDWVRWYLLRYDLLPTALVPASMNISNYPVKVLVNKEIRSYYFGFVPVTFSNQQLLRFVSDDEFVRPIIKTAQLYSQRSPTFLYQFSYMGSLGSQNSSGGVGHADELPYIWRIADNYAYATQKDILTSERMIRLWTNFARTGTPTPIEDPLLQNIAWPRVNMDGNNNLVYLNIDSDLTVANNPRKKDVQFWNILFEKYGQPPYSTY